MKRRRASPMHKRLLALIVLLAGAAASAQASAPTGGQADTPVLMARGEDDERGTPLAVGSVDIQVAIIGFLARTTTTLTFENKTDRTLEGELVFPLPEGATVSGYGLDIEGQIVDAVVVEAQAARMAFEQEVRRGIDPGLIEWIRGNTFRTRVWPIPAHGRRTVRVEYVSELVRDAGGVILYHLPIRYSLPLAEAALRVEVLDARARPRVQCSRLANLDFGAWEGHFVASARLRNQPLTDDIRVSIPALEDEAALVETHADGRTYFALDHTFALVPPVVPKPRRVGLLWDASLSHSPADAKREIEVVEEWLTSLGDVDVALTVFRNVAEPAQALAVRHGDASTVLAALRSQPSDGGTSLETLRPSPDVAYYVLVSDGLGNVGRGLPEGLGAPVYALTAASGADHTLLRHLARKSGGRYIPLGALSHEDAAARIGRPLAGTVWLEYDRGTIADVLPEEPQPVDGRIIVTGRLLTAEARITMRCCAVSGATTKKQFTLRRSGATSSGFVPRFWAERRAAERSVAPDRDRDELVALGKAFGIVTPGTSLLVMETLDQYLRHGIEPPESRAELRAEYLRQAAERRETEVRARRDKVERVATRWRERIEWWESVPNGLVPAAPPMSAAAQQPTPVPETASRPTPPPGPPSPAAPSPRPIDCSGAHVVVQGRVTDVTGAAVPGATVMARDGSGAVMVLVEANAEGAYRLCGPRPGRYVVQVEVPGFKSWRRQMSLPATRALNVRLEVGAIAETVEIAAQPMTLQASSATMTAGTVAAEPFGPGQPEIEVEPWDPETPYLAAMKQAGSDRAYATYLSERERYADSPSFYLDCAEHFLAVGDKATGIRVLTGILDLKLEDPRLLRVVAHRLRQLGELDLAIALFERVLHLRSEEPQSTRDLALALAERADAARAAKHEASEIAPDYLRSLELLDTLVVGEWDGRFPDIEVVALMDANRLLAIMERENLPGIDGVKLDPRLRRLLDVDMRVILTWDTDQTDMDLWVTEPTGEKCDYSHNHTAIGGMMSADYTEGYGPEEYLLRRARSGKYRIQANFYGSDAQSLTGPTTAQATVITGFGRPDESRRTLTLRLTDEKEVVDIGSVAFDATVEAK